MKPGEERTRCEACYKQFKQKDMKLYEKGAMRLPICAKCNTPEMGRVIKTLGWSPPSKSGIKEEEMLLDRLDEAIQKRKGKGKLITFLITVDLWYDEVEDTPESITRWATECLEVGMDAAEMEMDNYQKKVMWYIKRKR
jgi:NAD-dependent SIR2 family protein deacetylase